MATTKDLLRYLKLHSGWVTSAELAKSLKVSIRTLRNLVGAANCVTTNIISSQQGYCLSQDFVDHEIGQIPETPDERLAWLRRRIMFAAAPINIDDLSIEMAVSVSTLKGDLQNLRKEVKCYHLNIASKNNCIFFDGKETEKRKYISFFIREECKHLLTNYNLIQKAFPVLNVHDIYGALQNVLTVNKLFVNGYSMINLTLHICVCIQRIKSNCLILPEFAEDNIVYEMPINKVTHELSQRLQEISYINFSDAELKVLNQIVVHHIFPYDDISELLFNECSTLVDKIIDEINKTYHIDLSYTNFKTNVTSHFQRLIIRISNSTIEKNELTSELKKKFPLIYDIAVFIAGMIQSELDYIIDDNEIAYLTLHVGYAIDENNRMQQKHMRAGLLCPNYYEYHKLLLQKIENSFEGQLVIEHIFFSDFDLMQMSNLDILIVTYPMDVHTVPTVCISPFCSENDIERIKNELYRIKQQRNLLFFNNSLSAILSPCIFSVEDSFADEKEAIDTLAARLHANGKVSNDFLGQVRHREELSSTAFDNFAIPHAFTMDATHSAIAVSVLKKPVLWRSQRVEIIFMIAMNKNDREKFKDIFAMLTDVLTIPKYVERLCKVSSYQEMITIFQEYIMQ